MEQTWTILKVLQWTTGYFKRRNIEQPRANAEVLLAHVLGKKRIDLYLHYDQPLTPDELAHYRDFVRRRAAHEPSQYITQHQEFWSLDLTVNPFVLIPRPETELLVEKALELIGEAPSRVLDLGTGSGAIAIALAKECPAAEVFATDASCQALQVASHNAVRHHLAHRISFMAMDLFSGFRAGHALFDVIISNPPYIGAAEYSTLTPEVAQYEPKAALWGGSPQGLGIVLRILEEGVTYLEPQGVILLEIGLGQAEILREQLAHNPLFKYHQFYKDYSDIWRILEVRRVSS